MLWPYPLLKLNIEIWNLLSNRSYGSNIFFKSGVFFKICIMSLIYDNQAALHIAFNPVSISKLNILRLIVILFFTVSGEVATSFINSNDKLAYIFHKSSLRTKNNLHMWQVRCQQYICSSLRMSVEIWFGLVEIWYDLYIIIMIDMYSLGLTVYWFTSLNQGILIVLYSI